MRQTTIWDFLPQESSTEAKSTNQRNIMKFDSIEALMEFFKQQGLIVFAESIAELAKDNSDCQLDKLNDKETLLLANVNVAILDVMMNTLNQEAPIRNEQADTLVKLAQVRTMLLGAN